MKDLGYGAASAKKQRIIDFTPHHAQAALTVCKAALQMEDESKHSVCDTQHRQIQSKTPPHPIPKSNQPPVPTSPLFWGGQDGRVFTMCEGGWCVWWWVMVVVGVKRYDSGDLENWKKKKISWKRGGGKSEK